MCVYMMCAKARYYMIVRDAVYSTEDVILYGRVLCSWRRYRRDEIFYCGVTRRIRERINNDTLWRWIGKVHGYVCTVLCAPMLCYCLIVPSEESFYNRICIMVFLFVST